MRVRGIPTVGSRVTVVFLAVRIGGTVERVGSEGRAVDVVTDEGEALRFRLSAATGHFVTADPGGPRLLFDNAGSVDERG